MKNGFVVAIEIATVGKFPIHGTDHGKGTPLMRTISPSAGSPLKVSYAFRNKKDHAAAFGNVFRGDPTAITGNFIAHFPIFGIDAAHRGIFYAFAWATPGIARFRVSHDESAATVLSPIGIFGFETNRLAGTFAASLFAGRSGPGDHRTFAETSKVYMRTVRKPEP